MRKVRIMFKGLVPPYHFQEYICQTDGMAEKLAAQLGKTLDHNKYYILNQEHTPETRDDRN